MDQQRDLLLRLVLSKLGGKRKANALAEDLEMTLYDSYLLRESTGCAVQRAEYIPRVLKTYSGQDYFRPDGWVQFWWKPPDLQFDTIADWPIAYHGTSLEKIPPILKAGLQKPGSSKAVVTAHGNVGAGPDGAIYVTPSLWLAAHPVYAQLFEVTSGHWVQFVAKLRVRPGAFTAQGNTLGLGHFSRDVMYDPNCPDGPREWLVSSNGDVQTVGIMMREMGPKADKTKFGALVQRLSNKGRIGPEYQWTRLLQESLRSGGYLNTSGTIEFSGVGNSVAAWTLEFPANHLDKFAESEALSENHKELYTLLSPTFTLGRTKHVQLRFSPYRSIADRFAALWLYLPARSQIAWRISCGDENEDFRCDCGTHFTSDYSKDTEIVIVKLFKQDIAKTSQTLTFTISQQFVVVGSLRSVGLNTVWTLSNIVKLLADHPSGTSIRSPAFRIGQAPQVVLELYPNGVGSDDASRLPDNPESSCSLYLWPMGVEVACRLKVGGLTRMLDTRLDPDATNADACWGYANFCSKEALQATTTLSIVVLTSDETSPDCRPHKRCKLECMRQ